MITVPMRTGRGQNDRSAHWSQRHKQVRAERECVAWMLTGKSKPELPLVVTLTRVGPGTLDDDNLSGALKATRDQVAVWLGIDDRDPRVVWAYAQERSATWAVRIEWKPRP